MFSSLLYIVILFYQSIFSLSNTDFNINIIKINETLVKKDFSKAVQLINELRLKTIFINNDLEEKYKLSILKSNLTVSPDQIFRYNETKEFDNVIISSYLITKGQRPYIAENILINAINRKFGSDSLVHIFEILKSQNISLKNKYSINTIVKVRNKWNETEALQLLDMLKINEKLLL